MELILRTMFTITGILSICPILMMLFQLVISFKGFKKDAKNYEDRDPEKRFLIFVPAHNEAAVISGIVNNLLNMDYPKELYDFYILADNCTDNTAQIARDLGAKVMEFSKEYPNEATGKPVVLKKAFNALKDYQKKYDLVMFFDADNLIDTNMFREVNSQMLCDPDAVAVQCYLGTKNKTGLIPFFYYITFSITNRFFQLARNRFGLNSGIGGTGFAVKTEYIYERGGWKSLSLTEDFEFQIETTLDGKKIIWNNNVRVYDEKPTEVKASYKQQKRWAQGHWYVSFRNTRKLFEALFKGKISFAEFISTSVYMFALFPYLVLFLQIPLFLLTFVLQHLGVVSDILNESNSMFSGNLVAIAVFIYSFIVLFYVADNFDNGKKFSIKYLPTLVVSLLFNTVIITAAQIVGFFQWRQQNVWVKTEHFINHIKDIDDKPQDLPVNNAKFIAENKEPSISL
ncbi:MAG: glycosyltransferase family 2 protein [Christensenellaceae bacterium]|nr:glycosyltransferase family 2 protein [Christensenellaceae bacterium]